MSYETSWTWNAIILISNPQNIIKIAKKLTEVEESLLVKSSQIINRKLIYLKIRLAHTWIIFFFQNFWIFFFFLYHFLLIFFFENFVRQVREKKIPSTTIFFYVQQEFNKNMQTSLSGCFFALLNWNNHLFGISFYKHNLQVFVGKFAFTRGSLVRTAVERTNYIFHISVR